MASTLRPAAGHLVLRRSAWRSGNPERPAYQFAPFVRLSGVGSSGAGGTPGMEPPEKPGLFNHLYSFYEIQTHWSWGM